jgi:phage baseplate assembly protein W
MTTGHYRSWRFVHPDFDVPGPGGPGLQIAPTGGIEMVEDRAAVRQAILMLLATRPGERLMRPEYGCRIHWLVFAANDDTSAGLAIHYVRQALRRWEPRIDVLAVDANRNAAEPGELVVTIEYRLKATQELNQLVFPFRLEG